MFSWVFTPAVQMIRKYRVFASRVRLLFLQTQCFTRFGKKVKPYRAATAASLFTQMKKAVRLLFDESTLCRFDFS